MQAEFDHKGTQLNSINDFIDVLSNLTAQRRLAERQSTKQYIGLDIEARVQRCGIQEVNRSTLRS